jgi:hypothetical protein
MSLRITGFLDCVHCLVFQKLENNVLEIGCFCLQVSRGRCLLWRTETETVSEMCFLIFSLLVDGQSPETLCHAPYLCVQGESVVPKLLWVIKLICNQNL